MTVFVRHHIQMSSLNLVLAVPLDHTKKRARGFNQSELLSNHLASELKLTDVSQAIQRRASASPQSALTKRDRKQNVKDCFSIRDKHLFHNKSVLLVDDILTTGQTASECAKALKESGASSVTVLACARGV